MRAINIYTLIVYVGVSSEGIRNLSPNHPRDGLC
jgi:hypothetical protein